MAIKKIDINAEHKYVSLADDAIDREKSNLEEYAKDFNIKHLVFDPTKQPTFFILKNLSADQYSKLISTFMRFDFKTGGLVGKEDGDIMAMSFSAFEMGCKELEDGGKRSPANFKELPMSVVQEVSNAVMGLAQLNESEKK
jgi:hypothetical protein